MKEKKPVRILIHNDLVRDLLGDIKVKQPGNGLNQTMSTILHGNSENESSISSNNGGLNG